MRIYMATNVYRPRIGGITRSVEAFARQFRAAGHEVKILAPSFEGQDEDEADVLRVPAVHEVGGSPFSLPVPYPGLVADAVEAFPPDVVHAHQPFLLGATAHKMAAVENVPIVYTHHSRFDAYGHYFPKEHGFLQNFVVHLAVHFANLCDAVIAPGTFVRDTLHEAGVTQPIEIIPTGVDVARFAQGDGRWLRDELGIAHDAPVIGHVGRLAKEKNLSFLAAGVAGLMARRDDVHLVVAGDGEDRDELVAQLEKASVTDRAHLLGSLEGQRLVDCYQAMDVFAFASKSETQGIVITEAMAAGVPVVALAAPGVDDVLRDGVNGLEVGREDAGQFADALHRALDQPGGERRRWQQNARHSAAELSIENCAEEALRLYRRSIEHHASRAASKEDRQGSWRAISRRLKDELAMLQRTSRAVRDALYELSVD